MNQIHFDPYNNNAKVVAGFQYDHKETEIIFDKLEGVNNYLKLRISDNEYTSIPIPENKFIVSSTYTDVPKTFDAQIMKKVDGELIANTPVFGIVIRPSIPYSPKEKETVPPNFQTAYDGMVNATKDIEQKLANGDFIGAKGDKGDQGIQGDKGDKGEQGIQGIQGEQGIQGNDGYTPVKGKDYFTPEEVAQIENNVKATIPTKLSGFENDVPFISEEKFLVAMPKPTQEAESVLTLTDSTDYRVLDAEVKGTTKQNPIRHLSGTVITADNVSGGQVCPTKVESANKIPYPYVDTTKTENGVTFTDNGDGTITANGTPTGFTNFVFQSKLTDIEYTKYTLSGNKPAETNLLFNVTVFYTDGKPAKNIQQVSDADLIIDLTSEKNIKHLLIAIQRLSNGKPINTIVKPMLNKGTEPLPYTPYVSDLSQSKLITCGLNMFSWEHTSNTGISDDLGNIATVNGQLYSNKIPVAPNIPFYFKTRDMASNGDLITLNRIIEYDKDGNFLRRNNTHILNYQFEYVPPEDCYYIVINLRTNTFAVDLTKEDVKLTTQFNVGKIANAFSEYVNNNIYPIQSDGTVNNVQSVAPSMTMLTDTEGLSIDTILTEPIVNGELKAIGDCGKNLIPFPYREGTSEGATIKEDGTVVLNGAGSLSIFTQDFTLAKGKYVLSTIQTNNATRVIVSKNGKIIRYQSGKDSPYVFTVENDADIYNINFYSSKNTFNNDIIKAQIEVGSISTPYEPYKGQTLTLSQPIELSKWDSIFRDADGKWKLKVQSKTVVFNGSEGWRFQTPHFYLVINGIKEFGELVCDTYRTGCDVDTDLSITNQRGVGRAVWINDSRYNGNLTELKKGLNANPIKVQYELETPIITELPLADSQLLDELVTFYPQTTLTTDEGIILNVKYLADIEHFVERKFNELSQQVAETNKAIVSLGGI